MRARLKAMREPPRGSGEARRRAWKLDVRHGVKHALFHKYGRFYVPLTRFPAALCDPGGYVVFPTRDAYEKCAALKIGKRIDVPYGISAIPQYTPKPVRAIGRKALTVDADGNGGGRMHNEFTAIVERDRKWYIAYSPEIPGANGQGRTKAAALKSLAGAIALILADRRRDALRGIPRSAKREKVIVG